VGDIPAVVLPRENLGYSYGSWNHAFDTYGETFTHYILVEDDYAPWVPGFDEIMVRYADQEKTYVCSLATRNGRHGAISNGVIRSDIWSRVHPAPFVSGSTSKEGNHSQRIWTAHFFGRGFPVRDMTETHSAPFWQGNVIRWYGDMRKPPLLMPVQALESISATNNRKGLFAKIRIDEPGRFEVLPEFQEQWEELVRESVGK
jgi:hypothetical protein